MKNDSSVEGQHDGLILVQGRQERNNQIQLVFFAKGRGSLWISWIYSRLSPESIERFIANEIGAHETQNYNFIEKSMGKSGWSHIRNL